MIVGLLCQKNKIGNWHQFMIIPPEYPRHQLNALLKGWQVAVPEHNYAFLSNGED
jgi:hypothetical protein